MSLRLMTGSVLQLDKQVKQTKKQTYMNFSMMQSTQ
jgi:hypothetical protein